MKSISLRFFIVILLLFGCYYGLKPTYLWYSVLSEEQKNLANTNKKQLQEITKEIESSAHFIRQAIGESRSFSLALSQKDLDKNRFFFDISFGAPSYKVDIEFDSLSKVIEQTNPNFRNHTQLKEHLQNMQDRLNVLKEIKHYQQIKNTVIRLGLDIAGGVHFVLGIDEEKMISLLNEQYERLMDPVTIKADLKAQTPSITDKELQIKLKETLVTLEKEKKDKLKEEKEQGIDQALVKISGRVDQFGVSEPVIIKGPNNTIVVELAGEKDIESAKEIFTRVGTLSFRLVNEDFMKSVPLSNKNYDGEIINPALEVARLPKNSTLLYTQSVDRFGQLIDKGAFAIYNKVELDGNRLKSARVDTGSLGENAISFSLDSQGSKIFGDLTTKARGNRLAIVLDDKIQSAPNIKEPILGGTGSISGSFSAKEASLLTTILKSGSLPIPLKIEEERIIGPSLGKQEVLQGMHSSAIALLFIILFVFLYYGLIGGISTNIAQILNIVFILTIMAQIGSTLTLPGMAALILTIGMSIDANIIINERIKEDMKNHQISLSGAIGSGYSTAFKTILDSNLTTFIPAFILSVIGNGAIRGFGVTLMIGLITNLFVSVFVTRLIFDFAVWKLKIKNIFWSKKNGQK